MSQSEDFVKPNVLKTDKLTFTDITNMFRDLQNTLNIETYTFKTDLTRPEGGSAIGFAYVGYNAGAGLRKILQSIKINYAVVMRGGTGVNENSEIQIEPEDENRMMDLIEKLSKSNINKNANNFIQKIK